MGYSRAVVKGDWCFVSGVTGYDYATMTMPESVADQARNCFATIAKALAEGPRGPPPFFQWMTWCACNTP